MCVECCLPAIRIRKRRERKKYSVRNIRTQIYHQNVVCACVRKSVLFIKFIFDIVLLTCPIVKSLVWKIVVVVVVLIVYTIVFIGRVEARKREKVNMLGKRMHNLAPLHD